MKKIPCLFSIAILLLCSFGCKNKDSQERLFVICSEAGKFGYINKEGEIVIKPQFERSMNFSDGLAVFISGKKYGYINTKGEVVIPPKFDFAYDFIDDRASVYLDGKSGFIDKNGDFVFVINSGEDCDGFYSEGLVSKWVDHKVGFLDKDGKTVIEPQLFDEAGRFSEGLAPVKINGKWGFINKKGDIVIEPNFNAVMDFSDGMAEVCKLIDGHTFKNGYIDKAGKFVIDPIYDAADFFSEGLASVRKGGQSYVINKKGDIVFSHNYFYLGRFTNGIAPVYDRNGTNKWGYVNKKGELVIPLEFDIASDFKDGLAYVAVKDKWCGYINEKGEVIFKTIGVSYF